MELIKSHKTFTGVTQFWEHDSFSTQTKMKFATFIPAGNIRGALIFLSGLTCNEENFITKAGAQKYLAETQLMLICPDTSPRGLNLPHEHEAYDFGSGAGFYVDALTSGYRDHYQMYSYITQEIYTLLQQQFHIAADKISIFGHSMGGHGAIIMALRSPNKFKSVSAFAPIVHPSMCPWGQKAFRGYLDDAEDLWWQYDATELVKNGKRYPGTIYIDQGLKDEFFTKQLCIADFVKTCQEFHQPVTVNYREDYDHSYYFIATFVAEHVLFHSKAMEYLTIR